MVTGWEPLELHVPEAHSPLDSDVPCAPVAAATPTLKSPGLQLPAQKRTALVTVDCLPLGAWAWTQLGGVGIQTQLVL